MKGLLYIGIASLGTLAACQPVNPEPPGNSYAVIPAPAELHERRGQFPLGPDTKVVLLDDDEGLRTAAGHLSAEMQRWTGRAISVELGAETKDAINLHLDPTMGSEEGYRLVVSPYKVSIFAKTGAGTFYALQTLRQLLPANAEAGAGGQWALPCVEIRDQPRFAYRGMHLDVGRHFFPVEFIKKYIDLLALYKFNRFHWHLTEDQGWRIEIPQYPRLQEVAACREETLMGHYNDQPHQYDRERYCGYYTREQVREVVRFAKERYITIVPEIEMPGHARAAIAAYPELGCTGKAVAVATGWGVFEEVYCPGEATFAFLENVLTDVMDIFPSRLIHIGGDECPKAQWKASPAAQAVIRREGLRDEDALHSWFIARIGKFLEARGRSLIGWDELLEGDGVPGAAIMSWRGTEGAIAAAKKGQPVVMTPTDYCYFDYYQSLHPGEPLAIGGYLPLEKVYGFEPVPAELSSEEAAFILGAQGNVWTEYLQTPAQVEYMAFPRACALAEVCWTPTERKDYQGFLERLSVHLDRLAVLGVNAANKIYDTEAKAFAGDGRGIRIALLPSLHGVDVHYTLDGSAPDVRSALYEGPFIAEGKLPEAVRDFTLRAQAFRNGQAVGQAVDRAFFRHLAAGKGIALQAAPAEKYDGNGPGSIVNGVSGSEERYGGAEWLGFQGEDLDAVIDLGRPLLLRKFSTRFFKGPGQWIYPPGELRISLSADGVAFHPLTAVAVAEGEQKTICVEIPLGDAVAQYIRIQAVRYGIIPDGKQGAGHEAWLFVDELVVE